MTCQSGLNDSLRHVKHLLLIPLALCLLAAPAGSQTAERAAIDRAIAAVVRLTSCP